MNKPAGTPPVEKGQPGIVRAALFALCPRCGAPGLFAAPAAFAPRCRLCGCDFVAHELGARLLYPLIVPLIFGLIALAVAFDDAVRPPLWVHALIWPPFVALVILGALRLAKVAWLKTRTDKLRIDKEG